MAAARGCGFVRIALAVDGPRWTATHLFVAAVRVGGADAVGVREREDSRNCKQAHFVGLTATRCVGVH